MNIGRLLARAFFAFLVLLPCSTAMSVPATDQIDQKEVCLTCHDGVAEEIAQPVDHPPAASGECTSCHNPHVSRFDRLLRDRPGPMCGTCHPAVIEEVALARPHEPAAEGRCADCHLPHGGVNRALLREPGGDLCATCHTAKQEWDDRPVQHPPYASGRCSTCHANHGSDNRARTVKPLGELCTSCHQRSRAFRDAHSGYPVETADCQQCHDPHSSNRAGLFRDALHAPFEQGKCSACHALPGAAEPFRTRLPLEQLCGACHEDQASAVRDLPFHHTSAGGGACTDCHAPHTANGAGLLREPIRDLCLSCHDPGGSSSGKPGRFRTHDDVDCTTCHTPHGGERPILFAYDEVALCAQCHDPEHSVAHPMGEETRDPRNGVPMSCLSCHAVHDAPFDNFLVRSGDRDLCLSCHRDLAGEQ